MTGLNHLPERRVFGVLRRLIVLLGAVGFLGAAAQAHALVVRDRHALEARVQLLREAFHAPSDAVAGTA